MDEEDDDLYAENGTSAKPEPSANDGDDDEEAEMDEDDSDSDSDIEIVTERPDADPSQPYVLFISCGLCHSNLSAEPSSPASLLSVPHPQPPPQFL